MVWTQIETDLILRDATQMGLPIPVQAALQMEGIIEVDEFLEFYDDQWKTVVSNLKNPASTMSVEVSDNRFTLVIVKLQQFIHINNSFHLKSNLNWNW